jgi:hypothetical protein
MKRTHPNREEQAMTKHATDERLEEDPTYDTVSCNEYMERWGPEDPWGSITRAVAMMRRAMTAAGIAHDHVDDERLSRAVKESSPDSLFLNEVAARRYVRHEKYVARMAWLAEENRRLEEQYAQRREQAEAAAWRREHPELAALRGAADQADAAAWRQEHPDGGDDLIDEDDLILFD